MARVTDLDYYMEDKLKAMMDLCIARCTGKSHMDNLIIIDGDEGFGKSTLAMSLAYYVAHESGRQFPKDCSNVFFDPQKLIDFARSTQDQVIVWDEAALGGLSTQWQNEVQQHLIQLMMVARKKRHFYFFNIPKFFKLNEYLLVDRSIALIHVYARNEISLGRFCYFKKKNKEKLWYDRLRTKNRNYKKLYNFHGSFPNVLSKIIDEDEYDKRKDEAIMSIGKKSKENIWKIKYQKLLNNLTNSGYDLDELSKRIDLSKRQLSRYKKLELPSEMGLLPQDRGR